MFLTKYQKSNIIERSKLTEFFEKAKIKKYLFTSIDGFDVYDTIFKMDKKLYIADAKVRNNANFAYFGETLIELKKYKALMRKAKELNIKKVYMFIFFTNNIVAVIDLKKLNPKNTVKRLCNKSSQDYSKGKVLKDVFLVNVLESSNVVKIFNL